MKMDKKAITSIVTTTMILGLSLVAFLALNQWYDNLSSDIEAKKYQEIGFLEGKYDVLGLKQEGINYFLYVKSNSRGYIVINLLELNGNNCSLPSSNVIVGKQINKIQIECSTYDDINDLFIQSTSDVINAKVKLLS